MDSFTNKIKFVFDDYVKIFDLKIEHWEICYKLSNMKLIKSYKDTDDEKFLDNRSFLFRNDYADFENNIIYTDGIMYDVLGNKILDVDSCGMISFAMDEYYIVILHPDFTSKSRCFNDDDESYEYDILSIYDKNTKELIEKKYIASDQLGRFKKLAYPYLYTSKGIFNLKTTYNYEMEEIEYDYEMEYGIVNEIKCKINTIIFDIIISWNENFLRCNDIKTGELILEVPLNCKKFDIHQVGKRLVKRMDDTIYVY